MDKNAGYFHNVKVSCMFMETLTKAIMTAGWQERILTEAQLARLLEGSAQRRYNLVNRALHSGELLRLRRGCYRLAPALSGGLPHPFTIAQALRPGSYISLESALSFHGWIPEAVPSTLSILPGRRRDQVLVPGMGAFFFWPLALHRGYFLEGVARVVLAGQATLIAQPLRALLDRFCLLKQDWPGLTGLIKGLRIEPEKILALRPDELETLRPLYRHGRMKGVIDAMQQELDSIRGEPA
jgi:hypothetical protein